MKQNTVAICGENIRDSMLLEEYICEITPETVIVKYTKGEQLLRYLEKNVDGFDIIFLDVDAKNEKGLETAKKIRHFNKRIPVIFVSATEKYYRQAFDLFVMQYLLKPVVRKNVQEIFQMLDYVVKETDDKIIYFRYRSHIYTLKQSEILYISSSLHTVNFHLENGESVHCRGKLSDFEEQLKDTSLFRCHQSFYINIDKTTGMKSDCFMLEDNMIPISRSYSKEAQVVYRKYLEKLEK